MSVDTKLILELLISIKAPFNSNLGLLLSIEGVIFLIELIKSNLEKNYLKLEHVAQNIEEMNMKFSKISKVQSPKVNQIILKLYIESFKNIYRKRAEAAKLERKRTDLLEYSENTAPICEVARTRGSSHKCSKNCIDKIIDNKCIICYNMIKKGYITKC